MTGSELFDDCPDQVDDAGWTHATLNKDGPDVGTYAGDRDNYTALHELAKSYAVNQTKQEWCRYLNLLKNEFGDPVEGFNKVSIPMALWVDENGSPHPSDIPCASSPYNQTGNIELNISIENITVLNDYTVGGPGDLNLAFVLYTENLDNSVRTEVGPVQVDSGSSWPSDQLPSSLNICIDRNDTTVVATVQGWGDSQARPPSDDPVYQDLKTRLSGVFNKYVEFTDSSGNKDKWPSDYGLYGVTTSANGARWQTGDPVTIGSGNIQVTFVASGHSGCF